MMNTTMSSSSWSWTSRHARNVLNPKSHVCDLGTENVKNLIDWPRGYNQSIIFIAIVSWLYSSYDFMRSPMFWQSKTILSRTLKLQIYWIVYRIVVLFGWLLLEHNHGRKLMMMDTTMSASSWWWTSKHTRSTTVNTSSWWWTQPWAQAHDDGHVGIPTLR